MLLYKQRLWTFGGWLAPTVENPEQEVFRDLNCFDINSKTWIKVAANTPPEARIGHGAVVDFAGTMWLWGGAHPNGEQASFDTAVHSLNLNQIDDYPTDPTWLKLEVRGTPPPGRWLHSTVMNGTGMVIFGGKGNFRQIFADVHYFNFEKRMWSEIKCQGDVPSGRAAHGAAMTSLGEMWVYGGEAKISTNLEDLYYLKLETKEWVKIGAKAVSPGPLMYHVQIMDAAGRMWLAGGDRGADGNDKVFYIDTTDAAEWKEVEEFRGAAPSLGAAAIETNGRLWCYGGAMKKEGAWRFPELATIVWLDTNQPTSSTATTSANPLDPAGQSGGVRVGTIIVILLVVASIAAGVLFFLRRRREMRLLQEVQEPRQIELGPKA